jgi:hypothetical protein
MKNLMLIALIIIGFVLYSCDPDKEDGGSGSCNGKGTLSLTNESDNTLQKLMIDGVNYGTLDPGETKQVDLAPGGHYWQLVGITGGGGCSQAYVIIVACETESFECRGK